MKVKLTSLLLVLVFAITSFAEAPSSRKKGGSASAPDNNKYIDANKLMMVVANNGAFAYDVGSAFGKNDGLYFPFTSISAVQDRSNYTSVVFASGVWMGAIDSASSDTLVTVAEYSQEYTPGKISGGVADDPGNTNPAYRVYKLYKDSMASNPNADYTNWPAAQGAPVDSNGNPQITGDQMLWYVYNDGNAVTHTNDAGLSAPMGVEVQQSVFGFNREDALGNVVFMRMKIMNKGNKVLKNMYVSLWSDPDLGGASDDLVGCDTSLSLGFCYNATNSDQSYGSRPPAVGYDFFQGPLEFTGDDADTAKMFGTKYPQYRNLPMSSFNKYINGTDPHSYEESYNYMQGFNRDGSPYTYLGNETKYFVAGDPVARSGDLDVNPADRRFMLTTGPFTFRPGDSTEVVAAIIVGQCSDRLTSISALKYYDQFAQTAYDFDFDVPGAPAAPNVTVANLFEQVVLTWDNVSEGNPGEFPFEGYTVYQGESESGPWKRIVNFDVNNGVGVIFDAEFDQSDCVVLNKAVRFGNDGGIARSLSITEDFLNGGRLNNLTKYFYRVEAYSYIETQLPKTLVGATVVTAIPQGPLAGIEPSTIYGDILPVDTSGKSSEGQVLPIVLNPLALNGHTYLVIFGTDTLLGDVWHLIDSTTGDTVLFNQTNQTGNDDYVIVDGMMVKVTGPSAGFKNFEVVSNANGALNPSIGGSFGFAGFPSSDPTLAQQSTGISRFGIHTADNGGTNDGGTRGTYAPFLSRTLRDGGNNAALGSFDYEIRFTGDPNNPGVNGGYAYDAFGSGTESFWVPFELWRIGVGTPNDQSDDVRMIPFLLDDGNEIYDFSSWGSSLNGGGPNGFEHSVSGGDNDPFTDWCYWYLPADMTPGEAGYDAVEPSMIANTYDGSVSGDEVMARTVIVSWNGGSAPPFAQPMVEQGTVFRITTFKGNTAADTFKFVAAAPTLTKGEKALDDVRVVPNPYYLFSSYDNDTYNRFLKFSNLPRRCTVSIYTLSGDLITKLEKDSDESFLEWNVETRFGIPIASGIYIYVVQADGYGQKVGKMAIFTEAEQLEANY